MVIWEMTRYLLYSSVPAYLGRPMFGVAESSAVWIVGALAIAAAAHRLMIYQ